MEEITIEDAYKINVLEIAEQHKESCIGEECGISLILLREMAEKAGVKFSEEDVRKLL